MFYSLNALVWILGLGGITIGGIWIILNRMNRPMLSAEHKGLSEAYWEEKDEAMQALRSMQMGDIRIQQLDNERNYVIALLILATGVVLTLVQIVRLFL